MTMERRTLLKMYLLLKTGAFSSDRHVSFPGVVLVYDEKLDPLQLCTFDSGALREYNMVKATCFASHD